MNSELICSKTVSTLQRGRHPIPFFCPVYMIILQHRKRINLSGSFYYIENGMSNECISYDIPFSYYYKAKHNFKSVIGISFQKPEYHPVVFFQNIVRGSINRVLRLRKCIIRAGLNLFCKPLLRTHPYCVIFPGI